MISMNNKYRFYTSLIAVIGFICVMILVTKSHPSCTSNPISVSKKIKPLSKRLDSTQQQVVKSNQTISKKQESSLTTNHSAKTDSSNLTIYLANHQVGVVGIYGKYENDNPADNIFNVQLDYQPSAKDKVWLTYRLKGINHSANIACSINDRLSTGGYLVKTDTSNQSQRVELNASWLKKGDNQILFGLVEEGKYGYQVSDLSVEVEKDANPGILSASGVAYNGVGYVHGFVRSEKNSILPAVFVEGKQLTLHDGEFESIIALNAKKSIEVQAVDRDGKVTATNIQLKDRGNLDKQYALVPAALTAKQIFAKGTASEFKTDNAGLKVKKEGLLLSGELSATMLRTSDLPALDQGMINVTAEKPGVRFLPHGEHFSNNGATVSLKYDRTKIPDGYTENDIRTFYFDQNNRHWATLDRDTVDKRLCMVVSKTTHFTDMINGVIKTPESPQTEGFAPTMMNDIKAADPSSKIDIIAPPSANNQGSAALSYPIELPPMLGSVAPNLTVQYNSDGGSSWLGEGWDLSVPSIKVVTRWGVPRYDPSYETETYELNGVMLAQTVSDTKNTTDTAIVTMGHRHVLYTRLNQDAVQFFPVTENGNFQKIIRYGKSPSEYRWEVYEKNGTKFSYGTIANSRLTANDISSYIYTNSVDENTKSKEIQTGMSAIAEWKLQGVKNTNGDSAAYTYVNKSYLIAKDQLSSTEKYLSTITVTKGKLNGNNLMECYKISFINGGLKTKQTYNAKYGFLTSQNTLLDSISITQSNVPIRAYKMHYIAGDFGADLLNDIVKCTPNAPASDKTKKQFFTYQSTPKDIYAKDAHIPVSNFDKISEGEGTTNAHGFHIGAGAGFGSVGGDVIYEHSSSSTDTDNKVMMIDMDGDGLPDKLTNTGGTLYYCKNTGTGFATQVSIANGVNLMSSNATNTGNGVRANVSLGKGISVNGGVSWNTTYNNTKVYLMDVNNDGLVDIINDKNVLFNHLDAAGHPVFDKDSRLTKNPIRLYPTQLHDAVGVNTNVGIVDAPASLIREKEEVNLAQAQQDLVRVWTAQRDGVDTIKSYIRLLKQKLDFLGSDGIKATIELGRDPNDSKSVVTVLDSVVIGRTDFVSHNFLTGKNTVKVKAGQKIYFRLQCGNSAFSDGYNDVVRWPISITNSLEKYPDSLSSRVLFNSTTYANAFLVNKTGYTPVISKDDNFKLNVKITKPYTRSPIVLRVYVSGDSLLTKDSTVILNRLDTLGNAVLGLDGKIIRDTLPAKVTIKNPYLQRTSDGDYAYKQLIYSMDITRSGNTFSFNDLNIPNILYRKNSKQMMSKLWFELSSFDRSINWSNVKIESAALRYNKINIFDPNIPKDTVQNVIFRKDVRPHILDPKGEFTPIIRNSQKSTDNTWTQFEKVVITPTKNAKQVNFRIEIRDDDLGIINRTNQVHDVVKGKDLIFEFAELDKSAITRTAFVYAYSSDFEGDASFSTYREAKSFNICHYQVHTWFGTASIPYPCYGSTGQIDKNTLISTKAFMLRSSTPLLDFGSDNGYWGQFEYNSAKDRWGKPIEENNLNITNKMAPLKTTNGTLQLEKDTLENRRMFALLPKFDGKNAWWEGMNSNMYISGDTVACSRLNANSMPPIAEIDDPYGPLRVKRQSVAANDPDLPAYQITDAPILSSNTRSTTYYGGVSASLKVKNTTGGAGLSGGYSTGSMETTSAYMDMNGDGFPDKIVDGKVYYTNPRGGYDVGESNTNFNNDKSATSSYFVGISGSVGHCNGGDETLLAVNTSTDLNASIGVSYNHETTTPDLAYMDMNGDGLPDKLNVIKDQLYISYNLGYTFSPQIKWDKCENKISENITTAWPINAGLGVSPGISDKITNALSFLPDEYKFIGIGLNTGYNHAKSTSNTTHIFQDLNGDGLMDDVYQSGSDFMVRYNYGNSFSTAQKINISAIRTGIATSDAFNVGGEARFKVWWFRITVGGFYSYATSSNNTQNLLQDINGDGYPDDLDASSGTVKVRYSQIGSSNKLIGSINPIGGSFKVEYVRTAPTTDHPGGKWVMSAVTTQDGLLFDGNNKRNEFVYAGGKFDRYEHEFSGFADVTTQNINADKSPYRSLIQRYDVANAYTKGHLLSTTLKVNGKSRNIEENSYYTYDLNCFAKGTKQGKFSYLQRANNFSDDELHAKERIVFTPVQYNQTTQLDDNGQKLITSQAHYTYNKDTASRGDLSEYRFSSKAALKSDGTGNYDYLTSINYVNTHQPAYYYIYGLPKEVSVSDQSGKLLHHVKANWDVETNDGKLMDYGRITAVTNYTSATDESGAVTEFAYDNYGNINLKTLPANNVGQRMTYSYAYDPKLNIFPVSVTDAWGHKSTLDDYDYVYGVPKTITDINGNQKTIKLDALGRVTEIRGPKEIAANVPYTLKFDYFPTATMDNESIVAPAYAISSHYDPANPDNPIQTTTFADGFGRAVQVKKDAYIDGSEVSIASGRVNYDPFGRAVASYYPTVEDLSKRTTFTGSLASTMAGNDSTTTTYDALDRVLTTTTPDQKTTTTSYFIDLSTKNDPIIGVGCLRTTVTDALNHSQLSYTNGIGKTVKTVQRPDSAAIITRFTYDPIGELVDVIDTKGKITHSEYDLAGRRVKVTHPASGTTTFGYDFAGSLLWKYTANKDSIKYAYDYNRLKSISYPRHPENNVTYTYGDKNAKDNGKGRLLSLEDGSGKQEYKYGNMGEITELKRTLIIPNQAVATYTTKTTYDCWNRLQSMIYPDGEELKYAYNTGGMLTSVSSNSSTYVSNILYDKFEQRTALTYGNGTVTNYSYDSKTRRLNNLSVAANSNKLMDNAYTYDAVGNVTDVANTGNPLNGIGGKMAHHYFYDQLYRLKSANGQFTGDNSKTASYSLGMGYDDMHNITSKSQHITQNNTQFTGTLQAGYDLKYSINPVNSQQISTITDASFRTEGTGTPVPDNKTQQFSYDANGNLLYINTINPSQQGVSNRKLLWDEENRLLASSDNGFVTSYFYDAAGERTAKMSGDMEGVNVNGVTSAVRTGTTKFTAYISPYLVVNNGGNYTKHIYMGSQRITSKLSNSGIFNTSPVSVLDLRAKYGMQTAAFKARYDSLGVVYNGVEQTGGLISNTPSGDGAAYYYHSDHLGSSSLISNATGSLVQHLEYVPFGETFIDERQSQNSWHTPYQFSGKERDDETGLLYFGARYQDSKYGIWYSVDPLAEKFANTGSYVFCHDNPINIVDPDGKAGKPAIVTDKKITEAQSSISLHDITKIKPIPIQPGANVKPNKPEPSFIQKALAPDWEEKYDITGTGANAATRPDGCSKQDITVAVGTVGVIATLGVGLELGAAGAAANEFILPTISLLNSGDDAMTNKNGDSGTQQMTQNPHLKNTIGNVKGVFTLYSAKSAIVNAPATLKSASKIISAATDIQSSYMFIKSKVEN